jgi:hypothetical protein
MTDFKTSSTSNGLPSPAQAEEARMKLMIEITKSGSWFYWIAGMTGINTLLTLFQANFTLILGLGITQIIYGFAVLLASAAEAVWVRGLSVGLDVLIIGLFVFFGFQVIKKANIWAFYVGTAIYAIDTFVYIWAGDWLGVVFHLFVLWQFGMGISKLSKLRQLNQDNSNFVPV